jgi:branched-chain amino acid aminotransferase
MVLLNGQLMPAEAVRLPLPNRGLYFNDGFFETLVWVNGGLCYLPHHLARMQQAAAALGLALPAGMATAEALTATLAPLATTATATAAGLRLRLQLWRGGGGLYAPETNAPEWLATVQPFVPNDAPVPTAGFAETVRTQLSSVSFCKGPNSLLYVLAARERQQRGLTELLLLSQQGYVAESVAATIFWLADRQLYTPPLATGCVAGVRRAHLLDVARQHGLHVREEYIRPDELRAADVVFTANVAGIRQLEQLEGTRLPTTAAPLLNQLRHWDKTR